MSITFSAARRRSDGEADLSSRISLRTATAFSARAAAWSCQNIERSRAANSSSRAKAGLVRRQVPTVLR